MQLNPISDFDTRFLRLKSESGGFHGGDWGRLKPYGRSVRFRVLDFRALSLAPLSVSRLSAQSGSEMKELLGRPGSVSGLLLRVSQFSCAGIAIAVMVTTDGFAEFTCFCYLVSSMALQVLWSLGLACLDIYALRKKRDLQNKLLVRLFVVGDWVTATLSLAAASSSSGIAILFVRDFHFCTGRWGLPCGSYKLAVSFAFVTWILTSISSHVMFWILSALV